MDGNRCSRNCITRHSCIQGAGKLFKAILPGYINRLDYRVKGGFALVRCILQKAKKVIQNLKRMEKIEIRKVTLNDIHELYKIGRRTFFETFCTGNTEENMSEYLKKRFSIEQLTAEITDKNSEFYFAGLGGDVVGYLKLNTGQAQTEMKNENALEIERIYVLEDFHGRKVGQLLYEIAIQKAKELGVKYVWLGVWEENIRAISFYKKNGFVEFDKHVFKLGDDEQTDIMMKLQLPGSL